jgi:ABC-type uncharacterized transport system auxiliary subunit
MSWNRPARVLVVCAAVGTALTLAGCSESHPPALTGRPNAESTTTTTAAATSTTAAEGGTASSIATTTTAAE